MGCLIYAGVCVGFDDLLLAHLQIVVINKLRRRHSFAVSWRDSTEVGDGRSAIWLDPTIPVCFRFDTARLPEIDRGWLAALTESADSSTGLIVTGADGEPALGVPAIGIAQLTRRTTGSGRPRRAR